MSLEAIKAYLANGAVNDRIDEQMRLILNRPGGVRQAVSMFIREAQLAGGRFGIEGLDRGEVPVVLHSHSHAHRVSIEKPNGEQYDIEDDAILWAEAMRRARST